MPSIAEIASTIGFRGGHGGKTAEMPPSTLSPIDNGNPIDKQANVTTSIDCYVAGTYVGRKGQRLETMQRYTIYVSYSRDTQAQTMVMVRNRISEDFAKKYSQFLISTVFVPELQAPAGEADAELFYGGRQAWANRRDRYGTPIQRATFEVGTEKEKERLNIGNIRRKYGLRR